MRLIDKTIKVPARSLSTERDEQGNLTNAVRAEFGRAAVDVGTPDCDLNDDRTDAVDALANVMHWLHEQGIDPAPVLHSAARHFDAEKETVESRAVSILGDAGIDARLHHTGGGIWVAEVISESIPGRTVWIGDSEGEKGGPYFVSAFASAPPAEEVAALSGACGATQLSASVRRALGQRLLDPPDPERKGGERDGG